MHYYVAHAFVVCHDYYSVYVCACVRACMHACNVFAIYDTTI